MHSIAATGMHGTVEAQHDRAFKEALNSTDLVVPDGMPWFGWVGAEGAICLDGSTARLDVGILREND